MFGTEKNDYRKALAEAYQKTLSAELMEDVSPHRAAGYLEKDLTWLSQKPVIENPPRISEGKLITTQMFDDLPMTPLSYGPFTCHPPTRLVYVCQGEGIELPPRLMEIFHPLIAFPTFLLPDELLIEKWGYTPDLYPDGRHALRRNLSRLREVLGDKRVSASRKKPRFKYIQKISLLGVTLDMDFAS